MSLQNTLNNINLMTLQLKLGNAINAKAKSLGLTEEEFTEKHFVPAMDKLAEGMPKTLPEQLESFKKSVGAAMWKDIKGNPSLPVLVEKHVTDLKAAKRVEFRKIFLELLGGVMSEEDLDEFLKLQFDIKG